jgi:hypothetical protein
MRVDAPSGDAFGELRALADSLAHLSAAPALSGDRTAARIVRIAKRLGATAVPLLGRELRGAAPTRRDVARRALAELASGSVRERVLAELRAIARDASADEAKVCALGLLSELGEHEAARTMARFRDPPAMRRRSAAALAAQLESAADVASAADLMLRQLPHEDIVHIFDAVLDASPVAAARLGRELAARLDAPPAVRDRIAAAVKGLPLDAPTPARAAHIAVLIDATARIVVVASSVITSARGRGRPSWRRWAVLVGASGRIDDCIHEEDAGPAGDPAPIIASLCADGYRVASSDADHARTVVAAAARRTAGDLAPPYYLGRDLLGLGDAHLDPHAQRRLSVRAGGVDPDATTGLVNRAVELVADGDHVGARALLDRCDPADADVAAALAACLVAEGRSADALASLERARAAEPSWPLHHWNVAAIHHQLGDAIACYHALRGFLAACESPTALAGDPDQPSRIACAQRMVADLERRARLVGTSLAPVPARRPPARRKSRPASTPSRRRTARPVDE